MLTGSCLCGAVRYQIEGDMGGMSHCHCSYCRKAQGTNFGTYAPVPRAGVTWLSGEDRIASYQSSETIRRHFCDQCGSAVCVDVEGSDQLHFPVGNLDEPFDVRPDRHIFVGSKAPWYEITDDLPQHDEYSEGEAPVYHREPPAPSAESTGAIAGGSCNCGEVAFEYDETPHLMWNCHCWRCRKARGTGHATNLFVPKESFRWLRGSENITVYKLPEAERFGQAFCKRCGSTMPRVNPEFPMVVIPVGCMDSDPGARPQGNIFVGSRSSWFPITDDLPQHEEAPA